MEKRRFGRSGHNSSVAIYGGAALHPRCTQEEANAALDLAVSHGVNHLDVAASYGNGMSEVRLGIWLQGRRDEFFLGSKTGLRDYNGAWAELNRSLVVLRTDQLDLHQIHAVTTFEELDRATGPDGALEALQRGRDEGMIRYIGITGHGWDAPAIYIEALNRFDFDSILFPINPRMYADANYRRHAETLLQLCQDRDVGVMAIKTVAKGPWSAAPSRNYNTWYEPFDVPERIQEGVNFALSQPGVTGVPIAGDLTIQPMVLKAVENYRPLDSAEQEALIEKWGDLVPIF